MDRGRAPLAALALLLAGCGGADPGPLPEDQGPVQLDLSAAHPDITLLPQPDGAVPWLELGVGAKAFARLPADASVAFELGPQGSWMNVLALRGNGFHPLEPRVHMVGRIEGDHVAERLVRPVFSVVDDAYQTANLTLVYDDDAEPATLDGRDVRVTVTLSDRSGVTVEIGTVVRPRMP